MFVLEGANKLYFAYCQANAGFITHNNVIALRTAIVRRFVPRNSSVTRKSTYGRSVLDVGPDDGRALL